MELIRYRWETHLEGEKFAVPEYDYLIRFTLQLGLDEPQQMLLMHACRVVHMRVDLHSSEHTLYN
jgi:hypothetical protein